MRSRLILGKCEEKLKEFPDNSFDSIVTDPPYGLEFMNKHWDYDVPSVLQWQEIMRVLKPGGHMLAFGGTRTYHRVVVNIEDAGFEIRDQLQWIFGQGFPKSVDIEKATGDKQWEDWGTGLKPGYEPICLARKPLYKTIAATVNKYRTGGMNIGASRIPFQSLEDKEAATWGTGADIRGGNWAGGGHIASDKKNIEANDKGRFPANVMFDEEAAALLDEQSGVLTTSPMNAIAKGGQGDIYGKQYERPAIFPGDSGGASRFFYVAKADQEERHGGLDHMPARKQQETREDNKPGGNNPRNRGAELKKNFHPTIKPVELMQYLVKLITPPDGICCDPFSGSGSTLIACGKLGFQYVGIEMVEDYIQISRNRLKHVMGLFYTE